MVNVSGSTVTTSTDYSNLQTAYGAVTFVNDPAQSSAPAASYPSCPAQNSSLLASTTLPPTPNDAACKCLQANLDCLFNPQTSNTTGIVGPLLDTACGLIGQVGSNCNALSANGSTGTYGLVASCDPCNVALIYAFTSAEHVRDSLQTFLRDEYILRSEQTQRPVMQLRRQWHRKQQSFFGVGHCNCKLVPCVRYRYKCPDCSSLSKPEWVVWEQWEERSSSSRPS